MNVHASFKFDYGKHGATSEDEFRMQQVRFNCIALDMVSSVLDEDDPDNRTGTSAISRRQCELRKELVGGYHQTSIESYL